jgi:propanol-preferring alcohol dehydrogenase
VNSICSLPVPTILLSETVQGNSSGSRDDKGRLENRLKMIALSVAGTREREHTPSLRSHDLGDHVRGRRTRFGGERLCERMRSFPARERGRFPMARNHRRGTIVASDRQGGFVMSATELTEAPPEAKTATYQAAVVRDFAEPLVVQQVPRLALEPGQVRVKVEASGLCHTDIHAARGDWPVKPSPPFVPGHEGVGIVEELGPGVTEVELGDRVAMPWLGYACGTCDYCVSGWETLCLEQKNMGYSIDGGFGEYATAYARYVVKVPDGIDPFDAAPLTCAGVTTYKAVKVAGTRSSDLVAVFGVGGLGHLAIQYAAIAGGRVVAVDLIDEKLQLARELGAEFTVNASQEDPVAVIQQLGGADQAIALAVAPKAFEQAYGSLRRGGTLVFVALPPDNQVTIPIFETVLNGITIVGSIVGTRTDLRDVFQLHAAGKTTVIRETRPLNQINQAIADVEAGRIPARIVLQP